MFYAFLYLTIGTAIRFFFKDIKVRNAHNIPQNKPTLIVSNHPSAFMDPLVHGIFVKYPLYYLARADVFSSRFSKWIMKKAHMAPIYRLAEDGVDLLKKNVEVFDGCYSFLAANKPILLFGEGVTDEVFVRRVKSLKKGPVRIALGAENKFDFDLGVNVICAGINYTDPSKFRSDLLISISKPIEVKQYKELYNENPNKAMRSLNADIRRCLKNEVVYLDDEKLDEFFEHLLIISRKGMNHKTADEGVALLDRWQFSVDLANRLNSLCTENEQYIDMVKEKVSNYFEGLYRLEIEDANVYKWQKTRSISFLKDFLLLFFGLPIFIFGMLNNYLPAKIPDLLGRKISQRAVFYSSINMTVGIITFPLFYTMILWIIQYLTGYWFITVLYAVLLPATGLFAYRYTSNFDKLLGKIRFKKVTKRRQEELAELTEIRGTIVNELEKIVNQPG